MVFLMGVEDFLDRAFNALSWLLGAGHGRKIANQWKRCPLKGREAEVCGLGLFGRLAWRTPSTRY
jgi:hypothetical protein